MTSNPSGRCHDHRGPDSSGLSAFPPLLPVPALPASADTAYVGTPRSGLKRFFGGTAPNLEHDDDDGTRTVHTTSPQGEETWVVYSPEGRPLIENRLLDKEQEKTFRRRWTSSGALDYEEYLTGKHHHRVGGPAMIDYYADGSVERESWERNGEKHRIDGPSFVFYGTDGSVTAATYGADGFSYFDRRDHVKVMRSWSTERLLEEMRDSSYAPLLDEGVEPSRILDIAAEGVMTLDGIREVMNGSPVEWVRSWESSH